MTLVQDFINHNESKLLAEIADLKAQITELEAYLDSVRHCNAELRGLNTELRAENARLYELYAERDIKRRYLQTEEQED